MTLPSQRREQVREVAMWLLFTGFCIGFNARCLLDFYLAGHAGLSLVSAIGVTISIAAARLHIREAYHVTSATP